MEKIQNMILIRLFLAIVYTIMFFSCSSKPDADKSDRKQDKQVDFVSNPYLVSEDYSKFSGYCPKEGLIKAVVKQAEKNYDKRNKKNR